MIVFIKLELVQWLKAKKRDPTSYVQSNLFNTTLDKEKKRKNNARCEAKPPTLKRPSPGEGVVSHPCSHSSLLPSLWNSNSIPINSCTPIISS